MVEFRILGPLEAVEREPRPLGGRKQQTVLVVLLLHRGEVVAADRLIEAVWAGRAPATANKTLQVYVSNLRKALGDGLLVTQGQGYALALEPDQLDADRFERLAAKGREALGRGDARTARALLEAAIALWRGPALADFVYESFAQSEIARLDEVRMGALEARIEADLDLGQHVALVPELEALVHDHPLRERLYEQLMIALYRSGRQVDALERYQRARRKLVDEFGIEPGPRLKEVQQAVLAQDATLSAPGADSSSGPPPRWRRPQALVGGAAVLLLAAMVAIALSVGGRSGTRGHPAKAEWAAISSPASGGVYRRGQLVATSFNCGPAARGPALTSCNDSSGDSTATGGRGHLDTSSAGPHRYVVTVTQAGGKAETVSVAYTVIAPLSVSIDSPRATVTRGRTQIALACSGGAPGESCRGRVWLTIGVRPIARATYSIPAGATGSVALAMTGPGGQALGRARSHALRVRALAALAGAKTAERTVTLARRRGP